MKAELKTKSYVQRFVHTRKFYKYAKGVHEDAKARDLSCHLPLSYYFHRSLYRKEPLIDSDFSTNRVHHINLPVVGFAL
jgi:hypothetical protein